jgi:hypothetical protein
MQRGMMYVTRDHPQPGSDWLNGCTRNSGQLGPGAGESFVAVRCCAYRRREVGLQHASSARDERRRRGPASDLPLCGCATSHPDRLC